MSFSGPDHDHLPFQSGPLPAVVDHSSDPLANDPDYPDGSSALSRSASSSSFASIRGRQRSRRDSVLTERSYYGEMAQDGPFDGPAPDSVPSSISAFAHLRDPAGHSHLHNLARSRSRSTSVSSTRSFRFFDAAAVERANDIDRQMHPYRYDIDNDEEAYARAHALERDSMDEIHSLHTVTSSGDFNQHIIHDSPDPAALDDDDHHHRDRYKRYSNNDATDRPLLDHAGSFDISPTATGEPSTPEIMQQTVYLPEEDLIIALAGYKSSPLRLFLLTLLCVSTGGLAYLILRWLPKWRVSLLGYKAPLSNCDWVVLENQWGELSFLNVEKKPYNYPMSSVFNVHKSGSKPSDEIGYDPTIKSLHYFNYRYMRLILHPIEGKFELNNDWKDPSWLNLSAARKGLDMVTVGERQTVFGSNSIDIEDKPVFKLLVDEVLHPFYIFQLFSMILWSLDEYYYYATCILVISAISITNTLIETKSNMRRLREISRVVCSVRVLRENYWSTIPSTELVPGDIFEVSDPSLSEFPCDAMLLTGDGIINESMLTGESIPVSKYSATPESMAHLIDSGITLAPEIARNFLFCGTKIVRLRKPQDRASSPEDGEDLQGEPEAVALALAVRTGFNTTKGALVRSMLFPKPSGFKFYRDSFIYIAFMSAMAAVGFIFYTITFIRLGLPASLIAFRSLDLITIVVPPALPATLTIGTNIALARLKQKNIFCISPNRVNVGGKLDIVCFDKTGTLTEDGLDVLGVLVCNRHENLFSDVMPAAKYVVPASAKDLKKDWTVRLSMLYAMASCHSLKLIDDELMGDPLDIKMFMFTGWGLSEDGEVYTPAPESAEERYSPTTTSPQNTTLRSSGADSLAPMIMLPPRKLARTIVACDNDADPSTVDPDEANLGIIKMFEFVSQLRRMSVVVKRYRDSDMQVYVKGAPEILPQICNPDSFPEDYEQTLESYTHRGYRVIGIATKTLPNMSWYKAQKLKREDVEKDLDFVGFIVFENKLKPSTKSIIQELSAADLRTVMCTGDNVLTAISVARECELIHPGAPVFVPHFRSDELGIEWECIDNAYIKLDSATLMPTVDPDAPTRPSAREMRKYTLAITGEVFRWIMNYASSDMIRRMLIKADIYARMSPDEKHELVEKLQEIDYSVCFCGDGANDCGALKAADVGISLSEAEASVAAPFTSRVFEISCVPDVIREGRASLVTSFSCFKYMSLYSAIQFSTVGILYASGTNLGDFQFLMIDMFLILPIAVFMAWAKPYPVLSRKRPTANLVSQKILIKLVGQIVISVFFQFIIWEAVKRQPWYTPPIPGSDDSHVQSSDNTSLFLASCYQYIFVAMVLSVGPPYREPMRKNRPFMAMIAATTLIVTLILMVPPRWLFNLLVLTQMTLGFKLFILAVAAVNFGAAWVGERYLFVSLARTLTHIRRTVRGGRRKVRKQFKVLLEQHAQDFELL
ncbi:P-type ATPase-like protein [Myxozyma melibiosi]|uniref:Cation-transporting ATPase n=1 Tax=Myxozyma melibiosi TaxID=54550 RepID=A0ABR1FET1_9ASCO